MLENGHNVVCVVTAVDKPKGRGLKLQESAVKQVANEFNIPVLQPKNLKADDFFEELSSYSIDLGVIIAFRMLPEKVWNHPKLGTFNLHASLLPNYRGAAPINHAIINGEDKTGVTTFFLKHEIDTGDLLLQKEVAIGENENVGELYERLMIEGAELVEDSLQLISTGEYSLKKQTLTGHEKHAPKIFKDFCEISQTLTVADAHNKVRGLNPFPGAWCNSERFGQVKLTETLKSRALSKDEKDIFEAEGTLFWPCSDGALELVSLKIPGKQKQIAKDIINGYFR